MDTGSRMDRIYRYQRYFYDVTRPLFLPGRNALLDTLEPMPGETILEMGCGTARNLIYLARRHEHARLFGVDVSARMLDTARRNIRRAGLENRIFLTREQAEDMSPFKTFSQKDKFDKIFFSYSLSMIPVWPEALDAAEAALHDSGRLFVVDFKNMEKWPGPARAVFSKWLSLFHVRFEEKMISGLYQRFSNIDIQSLWGGYAFLATAEKKADKTEAPC